jgi:serine/threonine protein kinase/TolB-like protein/Tfp pilus assembly protein PilF
VPELIAGRYEVIQQLGRGAMGVVYLASDRRLNRKVAVKVLTSAGELSAEARRRFEQEAQRAAALSHPHIVTVFDAGEDQGQPYIVMEVIEGQDLADLLESKNRPPRTQLLEWFVQVCEGLSYAHRQGVVHRDLKPGNIRITGGGRAKILDFGIARAISGEQSKYRTATGVVLGTPEYMSPEGILGQHVDHRADIFSMGVILYEMITQHRPFQAGSVGAVMSRIVQEPPDLSLDPLPRMPESIREALTKALAKQPDQRYQNVLPLTNQVKLALGELSNRGDELEHAFRAALSAGDLKRAEELLGRLASSPGTSTAKKAELQAELDRARSRIQRASLRTNILSGEPMQESGEFSSGSALMKQRKALAQAEAMPEQKRRAESRRPTRNKGWVAAAALTLALALAALWWIGRQARRHAAQPSTPSIAVLPFVDLSPTKDQEYFADGLSEELLNVLAKNPKLRVAARTSSFQFKGKTGNIDTIGRQLKVATVLEGSVRKSGNQVRITAQLISVSNGYQLWSDTYDRTLDNIFAVQDDIAESVAAALNVTLLGDRTAAARSRGNPEAHNAFLQGRYFFERRSKETLEKASEYFEQALKLDPGYARAWAALAQTHMRQADLGYLPVDEGYKKARQEVERALELDHNLAEAHAAMGWIKRSYDWDWTEADAAFQRALKLEPGNATVVQGAAVLASTLGHFDEALELDRRAVQLDPLYVPQHTNHGLHALYGGRLDEAEAACRKALELNPEDRGAHYFLGKVLLAQSKPEAALAEMKLEADPVRHRQGLALAYHAVGRLREADAALAELIQGHQDRMAFKIAEVHAYRGDADRAFEWLERAYAQRDAGLAEIKGDSLLRGLAGDPRFAAFLRKMRLPP